MIYVVGFIVFCMLILGFILEMAGLDESAKKCPLCFKGETILIDTNYRKCNLCLEEFESKN